MGCPTRHLRGLSGGVALVRGLCAVLERKAARALGIEVPSAIQLLTDELIE